MTKTSPALTAIAVASLTATGLLVAGPAAAAQPDTQARADLVTTESGPNLVYRDSSGHVHVVRWPAIDSATRAGAGDYDLVSAQAGSMAVGTPSGYASAIDPMNPLEHVDYRAINGHVIELWKPVGSATWTRTDLTLASKTKARAAGDVVGWSLDDKGRQFVAYRARAGGHLHLLTWVKTTKLWHDIDVTKAVASHTRAAADPTLLAPIVTSYPITTDVAKERPILVVRGVDKHVHLFIWRPGTAITKWQDLDVTAASKWGGKLTGKPYGWTSTYPATRVDELHVVGRTSSGDIEELYGGFGQPWKHSDLTVASGASVVGTGNPQAEIGTDELAQDFQSVVYQANDHAAHSLFYRYYTRIDAPTVGWHDNLFIDVVKWLGLFQNGGDSYQMYVQSGALWVEGRAWGPELTEAHNLSSEQGAVAPATSANGYFT